MQIKKFNDLLANKNTPPCTWEDPNHWPYQRQVGLQLVKQAPICSEEIPSPKRTKICNNSHYPPSPTILLPPSTSVIPLVKMLLLSKLTVWSTTPKSKMCLPITTINEKPLNPIYLKKKGMPCTIWRRTTITWSLL